MERRRSIERVASVSPKRKEEDERPHSSRGSSPRSPHHESAPQEPEEKPEEVNVSNINCLQKLDEAMGQHAKPSAKNADLYNIDVCFMIDCTGSMGSYIAMATRRVVNIINQLTEKYANNVVRIAVIGYRDISDTPRFEIFKFDDNKDTAKQFIEGLKAKGGGDHPEDVNGAFQKAITELEWKSVTRILYHLADAPCHGKKFHNSSDDYPEGYKEDMDWVKVFEKMNELTLNYLYFDIGGTTQDMFNEFKKINDGVPKFSDSLSFSYEVLKKIAEKGKKMKFKNLKRRTSAEFIEDDLERKTSIDGEWGGGCSSEGSCDESEEAEELDEEGIPKLERRTSEEWEEKTVGHALEFQRKRIASICEDD